MNRYRDIIENLLAIAEREQSLLAVIAMGSSVREYAQADEYSDLDLILVSTEPSGWLYGSLPAELGEAHISFVEPTFAGGMERRLLYSGSRDVDLIVLTPEQLEQAIREGVAGEVLCRGYRVLYDRMDVERRLQSVPASVSLREMTEGAYANTVNDFWFHTVWAAKKYLRGELWVAKMCVDGYLKALLLKMLEQSRCACRDVWHNGRFLEQWADPETVAALGGCFARYDREELMPALIRTAELFSTLARKVAAQRQFAYPEQAEEYARAQLSHIVGE